MAPALARMAPAKLRNRTGKAWGSKFLPAWDLERVTLWIQEQVTRAGWTLQNQESCPLTVKLAEVVGIVEGEQVHTIRIVCDGHHVHAFPVKDE